MKENEYEKTDLCYFIRNMKDIFPEKRDYLISLTCRTDCYSESFIMKVLDYEPLLNYLVDSMDEYRFEFNYNLNKISLSWLCFFLHLDMEHKGILIKKIQLFPVTSKDWIKIYNKLFVEKCMSETILYPYLKEGIKNIMLLNPVNFMDWYMVYQEYPRSFGFKDDAYIGMVNTAKNFGDWKKIFHCSDCIVSTGDEETPKMTKDNVLIKMSKRIKSLVQRLHFYNITDNGSNFKIESHNKVIQLCRDNNDWKIVIKHAPSHSKLAKIALEKLK